MGPENNLRETNPFPGLRPFAPEDAGFFFGRDAERDEVILKLLKNRYITVIGPSGCGKSSLVYAGVLPKIVSVRNGKSSVWKTISFRPGNDPFRTLADALAAGIAEPGQKSIDSESILSELENDPVSLSDVVRKYMIRPDDNLLLIIDQFEELFRFQSASGSEISAENARLFVDFLLNSVITPDENVYIMITMRSEYLGECSQYKGLTTLVNNSNYLIPDMTVDSFRDVIVKPLNVTGAKIDSQLVDNILSDVNDQLWKLPVLQCALMRLWEHWKVLDQPEKPLGVSDYDAVGTMSNCISIYGDEIFDNLNQRNKDICAAFFKVIIRKDPDLKSQRKPTEVEQLKNIAGCTIEEICHVLNKFRSPKVSFITPLGETALNDNTVIDLQNESLIQLWPRLKKWTEEEASSKEAYMRLSDASALYQQGKAGLLRSPDLELIIQWRNTVHPTLSWAVQYNPAFERAMVYLRTSEKAFQIEEQNKIILQNKKIRRNRLITRILSLAVLIACGLMLYSFFQKQAADRHLAFTEKQIGEAEKSKEMADSFAVIVLKQKMISDSLAKASSIDAEVARQQVIVSEVKTSHAEKKAEDALIQKRIAVQRSDSMRKVSLAANENEKLAIEQKVEAQRMRMISVSRSMSLKSLQLDAEKELQPILAYQAYIFNRRNNGPDNDPDIYSGLYNAGKNYPDMSLTSFKGHTGEIRSIAFVPGKKEFYTSGSDGKIIKWSLEKKDQALKVVYSGSDIIDAMAVSPDASWLACGSSNSSIKMIPLKGNDQEFDLKGHSGGIRSLVFSYDGRYLYSAALDGKVLKWNISARTSVNVSDGSTEISSIDISSKGNMLAGINNSGSVLVWNPDQKTENFKIETSGRNIKVVRFNPDNNLLALGSADGTVEFWDVILRKKIAEVKAHDGQVNDIQFNTALRQMATAGNDKKIKIFKLSGTADLAEPPVTINDNEGIVVVMKFSSDGQMIISGESAGSNRVVSRPAHADYLAGNMCNIITRNMTQAEWNIYVAKDIPLEKTCQERNFNIKVEPVKTSNR